MIIPWEARKFLILSLSWSTLRFSWKAIKSNATHDEGRGKKNETHPQPVRTLGAEAQAFETETNTGGTETLFIWLFITFLWEGNGMRTWRLSNGLWETSLSTYPARVAARLGAHGTLCFWRSGAPGNRRELSRRLWSRGHKD